MDQPHDRCPNCGALLSGVMCEACRYVGGKSEFINNNHRCPKCNSITYIQEFDTSGDSVKQETPPATGEGGVEEIDEEPPLQIPRPIHIVEEPNTLESRETDYILVDIYTLPLEKQCSILLPPERIIGTIVPTIVNHITTKYLYYDPEIDAYYLYNQTQDYAVSNKLTVRESGIRQGDTMILHKGQ